MEIRIPSAFISYSWDDENHKLWVRQLATRLRNDGVQAIIDQWESIPGDQLPEFMEKAIKDNDYVLIVCTKSYKEKSDQRLGGVGYEGDIITGELLLTRNNRKFIPILRERDKKVCLPVWLTGKYFVDLSGDPYSEGQYEDLLTTILGIREQAPPVIPRRITNERKTANFDGNDKKVVDDFEISLVGIVIDEVTLPKMDGTRGSALYRIPIRLSRKPTSMWSEQFIHVWNHPPKFSTMHRPGIASVQGDKVILDGTTVEEVRDYHRDTLVLCVAETNRIVKQIEDKKKAEQARRESQIRNHNDNVSDISNQIKF